MESHKIHVPKHIPGLDVSKTFGVLSSCSLDVDPAKAVDEKRGVNGTSSQRD